MIVTPTGLSRPEESMSVRKRVAALAIPIAVAAGFVLWLGSTLDRTSSIKVPLSDGKHQVEFLDSGTAINYTSDTPTKAFLRKWLPRWLQGRLGPVSTFNTGAANNAAGKPELRLAFQASAIEGGSPFTENFHSRIETDDSNGFTYVVPSSGYSSFGTGILIFSLDSFPRRDKSFPMRVYEKDTHKLLFNLTIANPVYGETISEWPPETVPATKTADPVTVTLNELKVERQSWENPNLPKDFHPLVINPDLTITVSDPKWEKNRRYYSIADATGNVGFNEILSPFEPCWKLRVGVLRTDESEFAPHEIWTLDPVPVLTSPGFKALGLKKTVDGIPFEVPFVSTAGRVRIESGVTSFVDGSEKDSGSSTSSGTQTVNGKTVSYLEYQDDRSRFLVSLPQSVNTELIMVVKDQDGLVLSDRNQSSMSGNGGVWTRSVRFTPQSDTETVQLSIIVNRSRDFEFFVKPPESSQLTPRKAGPVP
jgi:hypothetical protein